MNYSSVHRLSRSIASVRHFFPEGEIVVVNNDATEARSVTHLVRTIGGKCLHIEDNAGFGAGCNAGARLATRDTLLFLNPDTILRAIPQGWERGGSKANTLTGAVLVEGSGREEPRPYLGRWPTLALIVLGKILPSFAARQYAADEWVSGAAFVMERAEFHRIGGFDERYFLYFEDIDLCLRYRAHGGSITRDADFVVEHRRGGSQVGAWRCQKRCYYASQSLFFNRYGRRFDRLILGWLRNLFGA